MRNFVHDHTLLPAITTKWYIIAKLAPNWGRAPKKEYENSFSFNMKTRFIEYLELTVISRTNDFADMEFVFWHFWKFNFWEYYQRIHNTFTLKFNFPANTEIYTNTGIQHQGCKRFSGTTADRNYRLSLLKLGYSQLSQIFRAVVSTWGSAFFHILGLVTQSKISADIWNHSITYYYPFTILTKTRKSKTWTVLTDNNSRFIKNSVIFSCWKSQKRR